MVHRRHRRTVAYDVRVALRENHDVARAQRNGTTILQTGIGAPFCEQMVHDDVPGWSDPPRARLLSLNYYR
jgi:hypothetical protein